MVAPDQRRLLEELVDAMRIRGVTVMHLEMQDLKLQLHLNPITVTEAHADGSLSDTIRKTIAKPTQEMEQNQKKREDDDELGAS